MLDRLLALFVTQVLLPSNAIQVMRLDAATLTQPLVNLLALAARSGEADARDKFTRLNAKILRDLVAMPRRLGAKGTDDFTQALVRTHGTIQFISRALSGAPTAPEVGAALLPVVAAGRMQLIHLHGLLAENRAIPEGAGCSVAVEAAREAILRHAADKPAAHLEALPFLLETLRDDLDELAATAAALPGKKSKREE